MAEARAWTRWVLCDWDLTWLVDEACFCVSELVTNAVVHAESRDADPGVTVRFWFWPEALVIEVIDEDPRLPEMPGREVLDASTFAVGNLSDCHRGLLTVGALADRLEWHRHSHGKSVWCRFLLNPVARSRREHPA
ncbi:ATP-binding protein [Embleya sp. NPDC001921]